MLQFTQVKMKQKQTVLNDRFFVSIKPWLHDIMQLGFERIAELNEQRWIRVHMWKEQNNSDIKSSTQMKKRNGNKN